jgi:hypothetical protein
VLTAPVHLTTARAVRPSDLSRFRPEFLVRDMIASDTGGQKNRSGDPLMRLDPSGF